jgi:ribonuclease Z
MESLQSAYAWDITTRSLEKNKTDSGITVVAKDIKEGIIYEKGGIKITAFRVDHADFIDSALGYRLDYKDRSVVISGDTRYSDNLIKYARGTDVLIHEVAAAREELVQKSATARQILGFHTSPEEAGKIFTKVNPRMAVYSHIILLTTDPAITAPSADDLLPRTKTNYKGLLEVGEDLMTIMIGDKIIIERHRNEKR